MNTQPTIDFLARLFAFEVAGMPIEAVGVFSIVISRIYTQNPPGRAKFTLKEWKKIVGCGENVLNRAFDTLESRGFLRFEVCDDGVIAIFPYLDDKQKQLEAHRLAQKQYRERKKSDSSVILWDDALMQRYLNGNLDRNDDIPVVCEVLELCLTTSRRKARSEMVQRKFLEDLSKYDLGQVVCAAYKFVESDVKSKISWPYDRYFLGMVRRDSGGYQRSLSWTERSREIIGQSKRRRP